MARPAPIGARATRELVVEFKHTLTAHLETLPPVLTTPNMIGLMETACLFALEPYCEGDEVTVGTAIHVSHRAPTPVGGKVVAEAVLEKIDGRFHVMRVTAHDERGLIGEGTVDRAFVSVAKFLAKTGTKAG
jgi:fluoroacetyl-CoA thioesterase